MPSKKQKWLFRGALVTLSACLVLLIAHGCSQNPANTGSKDASELKMEWLNSMSSGGAQRSSGVSFVVFDSVISEVVGDGKEVKFKFESDKDKVEFKFKKECLTVPTLITIHAQKLDSPYGPIWVFDCGPDGTLFDADHPVELKATGRYSKDYVALWLFDETTQTWEIIDLLDAHGYKRSWDIFHFSKYGIS
jgi:hypothetical protein